MSPYICGHFNIFIYFLDFIENVHLCVYWHGKVEIPGGESDKNNHRDRQETEGDGAK